MNKQSAFSVVNRRVDPTRVEQRDLNPDLSKGLRPDGSPADNDRVELGPTPLAFAEWAEVGLDLPDLPAMRGYRHRRLIDRLAERDYAGVLMFDPLNIRYATDSTNMQLWNAHNPFRACLLCADGYMVLWEYKGASFHFLSDHNPLVSEVRGSAAMFYFSTGDKTELAAGTFAGEVVEILREHAGGNMRLAVDKIMVDGYRALVNAGFEIHEGEEVTEKARAIKGPDEIKAMRCCMHACETSVAAMEAACVPGITENDAWAVLHAENIKRGGEWIETRLFASGPRTNPWFQECGPRVIQNNEICGLDTDLIGCYGLCSDISRTWFIGDGKPTDEMRRLYQYAVEHIETNTEMLAPGVSFKELSHGGHLLSDEFQEGRYGCKMHGVGLCDEWPLIKYPENWADGEFDYVLESGMMLCVEALIQTTPGDFSIKLENQVLITDDGFEDLTNYPWDARLMA
ncbi:MAG: dimethylsulfonioproprionate lyase DddP [Pseudomonadota bacterium]